jgi:ATP-dependent RNA helicase DHX29
MAPGKKKKKPLANPNRGFATVSLPSKAKVEAEAKGEEESGNHEYQNAEDTPGGRTPGGPQQTDDKPAAINEMTPEELEKHLGEAEVQGLVDGNSAQSQREASRQATRLETERRTLRLHAHKLSSTSWLSETSVQELVDFAKDEQSHMTHANASNIEKDLTVKTWTLRRLLESLGLPRTDDALKHVLRLAHVDAVNVDKDYTWGLQDSFEWYAHNADELDMPLYEAVDLRSAPESRSASNSRPATPEVEEFEEATFDTKRAPAPAIDAPESTDDQDSNSDDDNDPSKLANRWIELRRSMLKTEHLKSSSQDSPRIKARVLRLRKRLKFIESDPLFDEYEAELVWREQMPQVFAEIQAENSIMESTREEKENVSTTHGDNAARRPPQKKAEDDNKNNHIQEQEEADIIFGDMFSAPETYKPSRDLPPASESGPEVRLVDFGKWSGLNPRRVLEETCKIRDKKSRLQVSLVSKTTYSNRHKLVIHWSVPQSYDPWLASLPKTLRTKFSLQVVEIEMQQIATPTALQSEAYVSTVALFALCLTTPGQQKMSLRMPPVWRDVWQELEHARQVAVETAEKEEIRHVKQLIEEVGKGFAGTKDISIVSAPSTDQNQLTDTQQNATMVAKIDTDTIRREWIMKASNPHFQRMQEQRVQLPISAYRHQIVECVRANSITIISAETGAGKSTQVPSFLLEHNLSSGKDCRILVTQPRRISAITLARRVSQELGEAPHQLGTRQSLIGYSIRLESKVSTSTRLMFATTGVLLRMIETSPDLDDLDYLVLDEVHERTMDLDLLFIAVRHLVRRRPELKVILMSATVDSTKFADYFDNAPVLQVPGRTFPVEICYLEEALAAVGKYTNNEDIPQEVTEDDLLFDQESSSKTTNLGDPDAQIQPAPGNFYEYRIDYALIVNLMIAIATKPQYVGYSKAILVFMPGIGEIRRLNSALLSERMFQQGWVVHLLHSSFSTEDLERAFMVPPRGMRKIVISTNIAETGVTIPDVTAVIDTCKEKIMRFDDRRQMSKLTEGFISRSSSRQRRGRAARVQPGLCFHLVTKKRYDTLMLEQSIPEMLRLSLQDTILRIKIWNLGAIENTLNQAIDPPTPKNIRRATEALKDAGALTAGEALTPLGRQVARLPLDVSLSKLVILGIVLRSLDAAISIVAILSSKSPFLVSPYQNDQNFAAGAKAIFCRGDSDLLTIYAAYLAWQKAIAAGSAQTFCRKYSLSAQVLSQIEDQKMLLLVQIVDAGLLSFTDVEKLALRSARSGNSYNRKIFFLIPERYNTASGSDASISSITAAAFYPKLLIRQGNGWRNVSSNQMNSVAPNSVNNTKFNPKPPRWLSFYEAMQTRSGHTNAIETSSVPEAVIVLLLGEANFNIYAGVISIDNNRIRFSVKDWKTLIALKILRTKMKGILNNFYRNASMTVSEANEKWLGIWFRIMEAVDKQNEMAKARMLTSAHHVPTRSAPAPNGKPGVLARGIPERAKETVNVTTMPKQTQILQKGREAAQNPAPKRVLNPHADLHTQ